MRPTQTDSATAEDEAVTQSPSGVQDHEEERSAHEALSLGVAGLAAVLVFIKVKELVADVGDGAGEDQADFYAGLAADLTYVLFLALIAILLVVRRKPVSKAAGLRPRLMALAGTFMLGPIVLLTDPQPRVSLAAVGLVLVAIGTAAATYTLAYLGRSFSVMAEARRLVTSGPYRHVRHPLYVAEEVAVLGATIGRFSLGAVLLLLAHIAIQYRRALAEEAVLTEAFPEYTDYASRTARFLPGLI